MEYNVGLDIGTGSVGWAVIDNDYKVIKFRDRDLMGVRLFDSADTAAERRGYRTTRRRLSRRRWRVNLLNKIFAPELSKIDENFLARLKYSWVHPEDLNNRKFYYGGAIFGEPKLDKEFYKKYNTIYHLRNALINDDEQHDLREVYIAIHHLIKYRGNFLTKGAVNSENLFKVDELVNTLDKLKKSIYLDTSLFDNLNEEGLSESLQSFGISKSGRVDKALKFITSKNPAIIKAILSGIVGNNVNLVKIFGRDDLDKDEQKAWKFNFSDEDIDDKINALASQMSEDEFDILQDLKSIYDSLVLSSILKDSHSVSEAMIKIYDNHHKDLKLLKSLYRSSKTKKDFDEMYKKCLKQDDKSVKEGNKYFLDLISDTLVNTFENNSDLVSLTDILQSTKSDDKARATAINEISDLISKSNIKVNFDIERLVDILRKINLGEFLLTQRSKRNGVIPYQLQENELQKIIQKQSVYYPFLAETFVKDNKEENKIIGLLKFRVPYYVGPLVESAKVVGDGSNHWMQRSEKGSINPWNISEKVNLDASAETFIKRLTGTDTYLIGEPTLPKNSLLYQKYNVLQELNNIRISNRDGSIYRLPIRSKQDIYKQLFKNKLTVKKDMVKDFLVSKSIINNSSEITGLSDKDTFNSTLSTYHFFKKIFGKTFVDDPDNQELLEKIVELQTVFEDAKLLERQLNKLPRLNQEEIQKISSKHYTGWGNLSHKLLATKFIQAKLDNQDLLKYSIIDLLFMTKDNFMEIINNSEYKVQSWLRKENEDNFENVSIYDQVKEMAGSVSIKRGIIQSLRILEDIQKAMGGVAPKRVYLEFARETQESKQTNSRYRRVNDLYKNSEIKKVASDIAEELKKENKDTLKDDRLYLYFLQLGKDMYTGDPINLDKISSDYDIDHIVPQAFTKNDSIDNRVLVSRSANAYKSDSPFIDPEIIAKRKPFWEQLLRLNLISKTKFKALIRNGRSGFSEDEENRFIARSLVETRQIIKNVADLIETLFDKDDTKAVAIRSSLTSDMRKFTNKNKNRDINDYHHAHDALFIATVGQYIHRRGFDANGDFTYDSFNRYTKNWLKEKREAANGSKRVYPYSFVVGSMKSSDPRQQTNPQTGEIVWDDDNYNYLINQLEERKLTFSTRVFDSKGMLYKETRFKSKLNDKNTKGKIALSKNKSLELYGGFDSVQYAYSVLIYINNKFYLFGVRRSWILEIKKDKSYLDKKIQEIIPTAEIVLYYIPSEQLIIWGGSKMTVGSATELHSNQQLFLNKDVYNNLSLILKANNEDKAAIYLNCDEDKINDILINSFDEISKEMRTYFPAYISYLDKMESYRDKFIALSFNDKKDILQQVLLGLHANSKYCNLAFSSSFGRFQKPNSIKGIKVGAKLDLEDSFIFQSISGIFSRRVYVKDLPKVKELGI